ncbi:MAG TPA: hypothetical protein VIK90_01025, partial [Limnochordales bacterium]
MAVREAVSPAHRPVAPAPDGARPLVEVQELQKHFVIRRGLRVRAVERVTFAIARGETFALVGESGSG